jgi:RNA polymerase sigma-70 factor (ECF subfamily)
MPAADEQTLLVRAQTSAEGFGELFDAYYDRIYAYAYRRVGSSATAEDIAATVFEDALRGIKRVRWQGKPIVAWLYRIAARRIADYYRGRHEELPEQNSGASDGRLDEIEQGDEYSAVRQGLEKLGEGEREIIRMAFFDDLSGAEIAALLNCSANTTYVRLHRALKKLKVVLCEEQVGTI